MGMRNFAFKSTALVTSAAVFLSSLTGCATSGGSGGEDGTIEGCIATYTAVGAIGGALLGNLVGGNRNATGVGAAVGGIGGFILGWQNCTAKFAKTKTQQVKDYQQTAREVAYQPAQGPVLKVREFYLEPGAVAPGNKIKAVAKYYVMTPSQKDIPVVESRIVKMKDPESGQYKEINLPEERLVAAPGLRDSTGDFPIPKSLPVNDAEFIYVFKVSAENLTESYEVPFRVSNNQQVLASAKRSSARIARDEARQVASVPPPQPVQVAQANTNVQGAKSIVTSVTVIAATTSLRQDPDLKARVVGSAKKAQKLVVLDSKDIAGKRWYEVRLDGGVGGWVMGNTVKPD